VALVSTRTPTRCCSARTPAVLPIASITKLMTALVVTEARLPLDEPI
jgi:D-alanyl-D-alanine endopeptidase (penicillin-binding protein 7)